MMVQLWRKQTARERSMIQHTASFAGARATMGPLPRKDPWKLLDRRIGLSPPARPPLSPRSPRPAPPRPAPPRQRQRVPYNS